MILAEVDCSTVHSIIAPGNNSYSGDNKMVANDSLEIPSWLYRVKFLVKSPDRWSLFHSAVQYTLLLLLEVTPIDAFMIEVWRQQNGGK